MQPILVDGETLAAAALVGDIRVAKLEGSRQAVFLVVNFSTVKILDGVTCHNNIDTLARVNRILISNLICKIDNIGEP